MSTAIITGASSGLGNQIAYSLGKTHTIIDWSLETGVDVSDRKSIQEAVDKLDNVEILINCAGVNYPCWLTELTEDNFDTTMAANAKSIYLTTKALLPKLKGLGTVCNVISNASHVPMTCSLAYNASKGAAHIMTKQMAKELWHSHRIVVFGVSPAKLSATHMTKTVDKASATLRGMGEEEARAYQLSKLLVGEIPPQVVAEFIAWLLAEKDRHKYLAGCVIEYGANR